LDLQQEIRRVPKIPFYAEGFKTLRAEGVVTSFNSAKRLMRRAGILEQDEAGRYVVDADRFNAFMEACRTIGLTGRRPRDDEELRAEFLQWKADRETAKAVKALGKSDKKKARRRSNERPSSRNRNQKSETRVTA
jgi:hypothetical protein